MYRVCACLLLVAGVGCKGVPHGKMDAAHSAMCEKGGAADGADKCPLHAAGHHCPVCDKCKEKAKDRGAPREGPDESASRDAVVTQDIMLIPRMVYVPYGPQVPVSAARLGTTMPGVRSVDNPAADRGAPSTPREADVPKAPDKPICDLLEKCTNMMQKMDKRMCEIEAKVQAGTPVQTLPPVTICPAPAPSCLQSLFGKPHLPCLGSLCDKP
jgi:hypothetical protein